jgi:hypothetical protein
MAFIEKKYFFRKYFFKFFVIENLAEHVSYYKGQSRVKTADPKIKSFTLIKIKKERFGEIGYWSFKIDLIVAHFLVGKNIPYCFTYEDYFPQIFFLGVYCIST